MKKFLKKKIFYDDLIIKNLEFEEIELARKLHNEKDVIKFLTDPTIITKKKQVEWFKNLQKSEKSFRLVVYNNKKQFIGVFRLDDFDQNNKSASVGLDIVKENRGKKYSTKIYNCLIEYLFSLSINRLSLETLENNYVAINLYEKLGFVQEGIFREAIFREKKYLNLIKFSLIKSDYNKK